MTNEELNLAIAKLVFPDEDSFWNYGDIGVTVGWKKPRAFRVNYCGNWKHLMPLVIENGIDLYNCVDGDWAAQLVDMNTFTLPFDKSITAKHENPQIALAECLLRVLQEKADE